MLCSILIPTRKRFDYLRKTVASVFETVDDPSNVEVLLRVDDDDNETIARLPEFDSSLNIRAFIGPRVPLYEWIHTYYDELSARAKGTWVWIMNDDALFHGKGWDTHLRDVLTTGHVVHPEDFDIAMENGKTDTIRNYTDAHFPCVPNHCWRGPDQPKDAPVPPWTKGPPPTWLLERLARDPEWAALAEQGMMQCPADTWLDRWFLRDVRGWTSWFIPGLRLSHHQVLPRLW